MRNGRRDNDRRWQTSAPGSPIDGGGELAAATGTALALASAQPLQPYIEAITTNDQERVAFFVERASAEATRRAYRSDWKLFTSWCEVRGYCPLPATPVVTASFLTELATTGSAHSAGRPLSRASIGRRLSAIVFAHRAAHVEPPTTQQGAAVLNAVIRGIRKEKRGDPVTKKRAADSDVLRDMVRAITGTSLVDLRDRALLSIGMMGAFRRSELVAIRVEDVAEDPRGLMIHVPFSKGDQTGEGAFVAILDDRRMEPVRHYRAWIAAAGVDAGPVFRRLTPHGRVTDHAISAQSVALVVKARARGAGYDPARFAGHSLRAGFLTEAGRQGANLFKMKEHSRHKSLDMLSEYVRSEDAFRDHAAERFA